MKGADMALSYKSRRRWSLVILLLGLPAYIVAAWFLLSLFEVTSLFVEVLIYLGLGVLWAIPCKSIFMGIGQADPDAASENDETPDA
jgi:Protein of unknown function (DUF2842)